MCVEAEHSKYSSKSGGMSIHSIHVAKLNVTAHLLQQRMRRKKNTNVTRMFLTLIHWCQADVLVLCLLNEMEKKILVFYIGIMWNVEGPIFILFFKISFLFSSFFSWSTDVVLMLVLALVCTFELFNGFSSTWKVIYSTVSFGLLLLLLQIMFSVTSVAHESVIDVNILRKGEI